MVPGILTGVLAPYVHMHFALHLHLHAHELLLAWHVSQGPNASEAAVARGRGRSKKLERTGEDTWPLCSLDTSSTHVRQKM